MLIVVAGDGGKLNSEPSPPGQFLRCLECTVFSRVGDDDENASLIYLLFVKCGETEPIEASIEGRFTKKAPPRQTGQGGSGVFRKTSI